ncbi:MAG: hypothetical protein JST55_04265 [Bacteroidetes bacterium]|nr:hypothetical protein [Bacteroidota bacterium]
MNQLLKVLTPLFLIIVYIVFTTLYNKAIEPVRGYPIWMKDTAGMYSQQTSGLYFIGRVEKKKFFLSANDNGRIDRISVDDSYFPPKFDIQVLHFEVSSTAKYFQTLAKLDFEDIVYDKLTNKIFVSIEGNSGINDMNPPQITTSKKTEQVCELSFNKTILDCDTLKNIRKISMPDTIFKYTNDNIGFEGMGITDNYFFMGLENITDEDGQFSDSTYLYIVGRKTNDVKVIPSKLFNAKTVTSLCAVDDYNLYGVDRDSKKIFNIKFNKDFTIKEVKSQPFELTMPGHTDISMERMAGVEAIALDDEGYIYTDMDPWSDLFRSNFTPKNFFTAEDLWCISKLVPVLYKYKNPF